jgi:hypothetical protein
MLGLALGQKLSPVMRIALGAVLCAVAVALGLPGGAVVGGALIVWGVFGMFAEREGCE